MKLNSKNVILFVENEDSACKKRGNQGNKLKSNSNVISRHVISLTGVRAARIVGLLGSIEFKPGTVFIAAFHGVPSITNRRQNIVQLKCRIGAQIVDRRAGFSIRPTVPAIPFGLAIFSVLNRERIQFNYSSERVDKRAFNFAVKTSKLGLPFGGFRFSRVDLQHLMASRQQPTKIS